MIVAGLGARAEFDTERARVAAATVYRRATELGAETLCWALPDGGDDDVAAALVHGTLLRAYRFDRYRRTAEDSPHGPGRLVISAERDLSGIVRSAGVVAVAQNRARDLGNMPPNELTPAALAMYALELAGRLEGLHVEVRDGDWIRSEGMGAFAAVGAGSHEDQRLIELRYDGGRAEPSGRSR